MEEVNNKRELGQIQATLTHIQSDLTIVKLELGKFRDKLNEHCVDTASINNTVITNKNEIDQLRKINGAWNIGNSIGAIAAGVIAWIKA